MENVAIDSCVFFHMIYFNNKYEKIGAKKFEQLIQNKIKRNEQQKQALLGMMTQTFLDGNKGVSDYELINQYPKYLNKQKTKTEQMIAKLTNSLDYVKYKTPEQIERVKQDIEKAKLLYADLEKRYNDFQNLRIPFDDQFKKLQIALLYKKLINKEITVFIPKTSYKEITDHIKKKGKNYKLTISSQEAFSLLGKCKVINFGSNKAMSIKGQIARDYRTQNPNPIAGETPMKPDKNAMGEYGDSQIMAEANIAGMILITENAKDFITQSENNTEETKRRHIRTISRKHQPYATDVLAYTPYEFLSGNYKKPTLKSQLEADVKVSIHPRTHTEQYTY